MSDVAFHSARFSAPPSMEDTSVLSFVDRVASPTMSLTVATEALARGAASFRVYVDEQQRAAQRAVPGYAAASTQERTVGGAQAFVVEGIAPSPTKPRRVIQLYVLDAARDRVFVVTATAQDAEAQRARDAIDHVARTFSIVAK